MSRNICCSFVVFHLWQFIKVIRGVNKKLSDFFVGGVKTFAREFRLTNKAMFARKIFDFESECKRELQTVSRLRL